MTFYFSSLNATATIPVIKPIPVYLQDELRVAEKPLRNRLTCAFSKELKQWQRKGSFKQVKKRKNDALGCLYEACVEADLTEAISLCHHIQQKLKIQQKLEIDDRDKQDLFLD
jgi:hypothetical protein